MRAYLDWQSIHGCTKSAVWHWDIFHGSELSDHPAIGGYLIARGTENKFELAREPHESARAAADVQRERATGRFNIVIVASGSLHSLRRSSAEMIQNGNAFHSEGETYRDC